MDTDVKDLRRKMIEVHLAEAKSRLDEAWKLASEKVEMDLEDETLQHIAEARIQVEKAGKGIAR